jgi:hypothetical protein
MGSRTDGGRQREVVAAKEAEWSDGREGGYLSLLNLNWTHIDLLERISL